MPELSPFFSIIIHFHAYHQDDVSIFGIDPVDLIAGKLPRRQRRLVEAWGASPRGADGRRAGRAFDDGTAQTIDFEPVLEGEFLARSAIRRSFGRSASIPKCTRSCGPTSIRPRCPTGLTACRRS
jgi:hypothetical protein